MKNILYIINTDDINIYNKILVETNNIYVTSYSFEILEKYSKLDNVKETLYLEEMYTIFQCSKEVKKIINEINSFSYDLFDEPLLEVPIHVEGGNNQKIQDIVLFKMSFEKILKEYKIDSIVNNTNKEFLIENKFIKDIAYENNLKYKVYIKGKITYIKKLLLTEYKKYFIIINYFKKYILINTRFKKNKFNTNKQFIFISLFSSRKNFQKSFNYFSNLIEQNSSFKCKVLVSNLDKKSNIDLIKYNPYFLEHYIKIQDFFYSFLISSKYLIRLKLNNKFFNEKFKTYDKSIFNQIKEVMSYQIIAEYNNNYRLKKGYKRFFSLNKMSAFKLWGGISLNPGKIAVRAIEEKELNIKTFEFDIGNDYKEFPYVPDNLNLIDYKIVFSEEEKDKCLYQGYKENQLLLLPSLSIKKNILLQSKKIKTEESFKVLNIEQKYKEYIFIDIKVKIRGYISHQEIEQFLTATKKLAINYNNYAFIIKPHPSFKEFKYLEDLFCGIKNIYLYLPTLDIFHFLNISTIIITKQSTVGFEALELNKIIISVITDGDINWKVYGDKAYYFFNFDEVLTFLSKKNMPKTNNVLKIEDSKFDVLNFIEKLK